MPQKRKLEEYHDPDYPLSSPPKNVVCVANKSNQSFEPIQTPSPVPQSASDTRKDKIMAVVKREFEVEFKAKEREIDEIEKRITRGRQLLAKVRYAVVQSYYTKKSLIYSEEELKQAASDAGEQSIAESSCSLAETLSLQPAIHPSLKKILGKRPLDYNELLKVRPVREAAKHATQKFHELKKQPSTKLKMANITIPAEPVEETICEDIPEAPNEVIITFKLMFYFSGGNGITVLISFTVTKDTTICEPK